MPTRPAARRGSVVFMGVSSVGARLDERSSLLALALLLRNHPSALPVALDVNALSQFQCRVGGLRHHDQHAAPETHDDLLSSHGLVVFLLDVVSQESTPQRTGDHRHVASGAPTDQATDSQAAEAADDGPDTAMMVAWQLDVGDLLDHTLTNLRFYGLLGESLPGSQHES